MSKIGIGSAVALAGLTYFGVLPPVIGTAFTTCVGCFAAHFAYRLNQTDFLKFQTLHDLKRMGYNDEDDLVVAISNMDNEEFIQNRRAAQDLFERYTDGKKFSELSIAEINSTFEKMIRDQPTAAVTTIPDDTENAINVEIIRDVQPDEIRHRNRHTNNSSVAPVVVTALNANNQRSSNDELEI